MDTLAARHANNLARLGQPCPVGPAARSAGSFRVGRPHPHPPRSPLRGDWGPLRGAPVGESSGGSPGTPPGRLPRGPPGGTLGGHPQDTPGDTPGRSLEDCLGVFFGDVFNNPHPPEGGGGALLINPHSCLDGSEPLIQKRCGRELRIWEIPLGDSPGDVGEADPPEKTLPGLPDPPRQHLVAQTPLFSTRLQDSWTPSLATAARGSQGSQDHSGGNLATR
jgi:hypothetical protein